MRILTGFDVIMYMVDNDVYYLVVVFLFLLSFWFFLLIVGDTGALFLIFICWLLEQRSFVFDLFGSGFCELRSGVGKKPRITTKKVSKY